MSTGNAEVGAVQGSKEGSSGVGRSAATGSWRSDGPRVLEALMRLREEVAAVHAALAHLDRGVGDSCGEMAGGWSDLVDAEGPKASGERLDGRTRKSKRVRASRLMSGVVRMARRCGDLGRMAKARWQQRASVASSLRAEDPSPCESEQRVGASAAAGRGAAADARHLGRPILNAEKEPRRHHGMVRRRAQADCEDEDALRGLRAIYRRY